MTKSTLLSRGARAVCFAALATAGLSSTAATAATYAAIQDTTIYQPIGNLGANFGTGGDSGGIQFWNHEAGNGAQALIQFDSAWMNDPLLSGNFVATLNVYELCQLGGFVQACPGEPGAESTTTDLFIQDSAWSELDPALGWDDVTNTGEFASFTQTGNTGWLQIDVTNLIQSILQNGVDYGFAISQEAYPVVRNDNGDLAISTFCDSESSFGFCSTGDFTPFLEIRAVPLPAAAWLFLAALGSLGVARRRSA
ncbi:MAG: VPLPA-CTERM sorting domain-containing protein [Pseudomonadota bacterium]